MAVKLTTLGVDQRAAIGELLGIAELTVLSKDEGVKALTVFIVERARMIASDPGLIRRARRSDLRFLLSLPCLNRK
jgi:hypothetical protein